MATAHLITLIAATRLDAALSEQQLRAWLELEIHDDLTVESYFGDCYKVIVACREAMESVKMPSCPEMIFEAEQKIGSHLGSTREVNAEILELARENPLALYKLCRQDLRITPDEYAKLT